MKNVNIITMAGKGQRFINLNYKTPKPLVMIDNIPMFIKASTSLPISNKYIFLCNSKIIKATNIYEIINKYYLNYKIVEIKRVTKGQAITCNKALKYINKKQQLNFAACDASYKITKSELEKKIKDNDIIIYVAKSTINEIKNVNSYGWVSYKKKIINITCKSKASNDPKKDYVIIGSFSFKNKDVFTKCYDYLRKKQIKINNEYYMDSLVKVGLIIGFKIDIIVVKDFINLGDPKLLKDQTHE